jgi:hypothetical protein
VSQRSNDYFARNGRLQRIKCAPARTEVRARAGGTPDSLQDLSGAPCDSSLHQTTSLVVGVINTPNHPTFKSSKFSTFQLLTRALAFNSRHTQVIESSPNSTQALVISERDLLCSFELLRLDCFLSHSFLRSNSLVIQARDTNHVVVLVGTLCSN